MADAMEHADDEFYAGESSSGDDEEQLPSSSSNAYSRAFGKIMSKSSSPDALGPVLADRKQLVGRKLEEEVEEQRKSAKRKHNQEIREKGHVVPDGLSDAKELVLKKLATKGVVKLFNAVSQAQKVQTGSESLKSRDAKALVKRTKAAFMSGLKAENKRSKHEDTEEADDKPGWSVLQDDFMLGGSKLKDWDKQQDTGNDSDAFDKDSSGSEDD